MKNKFWWISAGQTYHVTGTQPSITLADGEDVVSLALVEKTGPAFKVKVTTEDANRRRDVRTHRVPTKKLLEWEALGDISLATSAWDHIDRCI